MLAPVRAGRSELRPMPRVRLRDIVTFGDQAAVMGLRLGPGQDEHLNSMQEIFEEAERDRSRPT